MAASLVDMADFNLLLANCNAFELILGDLMSSPSMSRVQVVVPV
jgi:hypothetical protein